MATIAQRLQNLIDAANATTTLSDTNMTDAVESLISGYGKGGGGKTATVTITAPTGSTVTLTDGIETLTTSEIDGVWTFRNVPYGIWAVVVITDNVAQSKDLTVLSNVSEIFFKLGQVVDMPGNSLVNGIPEYAVSSEGNGVLEAGVKDVGEENPNGCLNITFKSLFGYIPSENGFKQFSFKCRAKISNFNSNGCLFGMHNSNGAGINFFVFQNRIVVRHGLSNQVSDIIEALYPVIKDKWHTFEFSYSENKCSVIFDGVTLIDFPVTPSIYNGNWTAFKINNYLAGENWIANHSSGSYLSMNIEKIELLCG